jgi:prolipoprotein diacylglyceryl transferase
VNWLSSIPSPAEGTLPLGPIDLHAYGLMLAIGVIVAARIADRRAARLGLPEGAVGEVATIVVVFGVIGARIYHLFTGYDWDDKGVLGALRIWEGGLSIWGAVGGGAVGVFVMARRKRIDAIVLLDAIAPAVAVAQGIGRWGNWFNQELFGRPTDLPWGLEISCGKSAQVGYPCATRADQLTFHPTFLYESIYCFALFFVLTWAERRFRFRRGQTFSLYVAFYCVARFFMELLRVDPASELFGVRFNALLSIVLAVVGLATFVILGRRGAADAEIPETTPMIDTPIEEDV